MGKTADTSKCALIIFAKEPKLGKVKTRLQKDIPAHQVLKLYKAFVKDVLLMSEKVSGCERFLYYSGAVSSGSFLNKFKTSFILKKQIGADLGERMYRAFCCAQRNGYSKVVIIGTDCPEIDSGDIQKAFKQLSRYDGVLGPSFDGGYYLIGLRIPKRLYFRNISWSSSSVLQKTLQNARHSGKRLFLLKKKGDIDEISDLRRLCATSKVLSKRKNTRQALKKIKF